MTHHYTAIIVKSGEWFAGTVKELSGVHTQGKTIEEVKENLQEAITMVIESNLKHFLSEEIDLSDIPELTDEQLSAMKPLREIFPDIIPSKIRITLQLDTDIISWFKEHVQQEGGINYQTLMNDALRKYIENQKESLALTSINELEDTLRRVVREELQSIS